MPLDVLQPALRSGIDDLHRKFFNAEPFRHIIFDQFFTEEFCESLLRDFPPFDPALAMSEIGVPGNKAVVERLPEISSVYGQLDQLIQSREFLLWLGALTGIPDLLYDPHYYGGGTHENLHGEELDVHVDFNYHPKSKTHRRLNLIVFLNPEWDPDWGGCLELHKRPWDGPANDHVITVIPLFNRCVIFETTESSWHGFRRIQLPSDRQSISRRSIAVYFYSQQRPAAETAPHHSTVYVPWMMADHLQPGYTLTETDVNELKVLFRHRDERIRFFYEREKEFSTLKAMFNSVLASKSFKLARLLSAPVRSLRRAK